MSESTLRFDGLPFFIDLAAQIEGVTQVQMEAVVPPGRLSAELQPARVGTLPDGLRALFYLKQKAVRDAQVAVLDIDFAPVGLKDDAKTRALSLGRRAKWLEATFHEAVLHQFAALGEKEGFGIGPRWSVLDLNQVSQLEEPDGLSGLLSSLLASGHRQRQPH